MARRELSADEEMQLIEDAERRRDDPSATLGKGKRVNRGPNATTVVSVRLPVDDARRLRDLAADRGKSLSEILQEAVDAWRAESLPQVSYKVSFGSIIVRKDVGLLEDYPNPYFEFSMTGAEAPSAVTG